MAMSTRTKFKIAGPVAVLGGIVLTAGGFQQSAISAKVAAEGVVTKGRVVSHQIISGRRGSRTYKLSTEYQPEGSGPGIQKEFSVPEAIYKANSDGGELDVRYVPSDPSASELVGAEANSVDQIGPGVLALLFGVVASFFAYRKPATAA